MAADKRQSVRCEEASIAGRRVSYWAGGSGQALVLVHGVASDADFHWNRVMKRLNSRFTVYAPDLPGYGNSDPLKSPTLAGYVEWLQDFMEFHKLSKAIIVGHSMGASIVRVLAAKSPALAEGVILVDGGHVPNVTTTVKVLMKLPMVANRALNKMKTSAFTDERIKSMVHNQALANDEFVSNVRRYEAQFMPIVRKMLVTAPPAQLTPECPVLILWGEHDKFEDQASGKQLAEMIPNAVFEPIKGAGHMSMLDNPKEIVELVIEFADQLKEKK